MLYKFRTMTNALDAEGNLLADKQRLTAFGRWLRSTSLDEVPELWNLLRGDTSLVGPRPLLLENLPLYSREQAGRHKVRPSLTGWVQINNRNALTWSEKFVLDVWYVDKQPFALDLKIFFRTVAAILHRKGISDSGDAAIYGQLGR